MSEQHSALFICLGNICRSPIAEAVFLQVLKDRGLKDKWKVDSAAIGPWHVGKRPDHRVTLTLQKHNIPYNNRARQVTGADFDDYEFIFGMDNENMEDLRSQKKDGSRAKILLLGDYDPRGDSLPSRIIRDPYYDSGAEGFKECYERCVRCCNGFIDSL